MTSLTPQSALIRRTFFPYMDERSANVAAAGGRFAYYTTAETATRILQTKRIWMRSTAAMNDYTEVDHGFECLTPAYEGEPGNRLRTALDACFPGLGEELRVYFEGWRSHIALDTYMTCVSEHLQREDRLGRLSMWRAYGGQTGVALVLNGAVMFSEADVGVYASPVAYLEPAEFAVEFTKVVANIERETAYLKTLSRDTVKHMAFRVLRYAVLCTKHRGFEEELEWRVIASPRMYESPLLEPYSIEVVRGTPQKVLKLVLENHPDKGLLGLALPELLDKIIIGPCEFPVVILQAFHQLLEEAGVPEPWKKVVVSDIPLRNP